MKKHRLKEIQKILSEEDINSQEALISKLEDRGHKITQATLSRDLAYLKVGKVFLVNKGYVYVLPRDLKNIEARSYPVADNLTGLLSVIFSGNIAVIHTLPGYAAQICVSIDNAKIPGCIGTIAGDDTIIAVVDENITQSRFKKELLEHFPELKDRL